MLDLWIRGGTIIDGTGAPRFEADLGIRDGLIACVGATDEQAEREIDAHGLLVTPGWVDVHTHYDGQVTWDPYLTPSFWHGVTTVVMGNCGVGFATAQPDQHDWLISLMEGVEDIPGTALAEGIKWEWQSFPEYLDSIEKHPHALDIVAQVPHGALRAFVMGERGADHTEKPTPEEIETMGRLAREAIAAGAVGAVTAAVLDLPGTLGLIAFSMALAVVAQGGDLVESAVKRHFKVKDSGTIIPGHGGLLDRLDGLLTAAPAVAAVALMSGEGVLAWR